MKVFIVQCLCMTVLKVKKMCDKTVEKDSKMLKFAPDYFKTQGMCEKAVKKSIVCNNTCSWSKLFQKILECYDFIPNYYKTWEMSEKVVDYYPHALEYIADLPYV